jgi:hypothetical protein
MEVLNAFLVLYRSGYQHNGRSTFMDASIAEIGL